jgi:hypothetical protein
LVEYLAGNFDEAKNFGRRGLEHDPTNDMMLKYQAMISFEQGDFDQGMEFVDRWVELSDWQSVSGAPTAAYFSVFLPTMSKVPGREIHLDLARSCIDRTTEKIGMGDT